MRTDTLTLAEALNVIARTMKSEDGVVPSAIAEASRRLREQRDLLVRADNALDNCGIGAAAPVRVNIRESIR